MQITLSDLEVHYIKVALNLEIFRIERRIEKDIPAANHLTVEDKQELIETWNTSLKGHNELLKRFNS